MQQMGGWLLVNYSNESLGLHLAAQKNNSPRSQPSPKTLLVVSLLSTVLGKKIVVVQLKIGVMQLN